MIKFCTIYLDIMAKSLVKFTNQKDAVDLVMNFAEEREWLQHPDKETLGKGSLADLKYWSAGAKRAVFGLFARVP